VVDHWARHVQQLVTARYPGVPWQCPTVKKHSIIAVSQPYEFLEKGLFRTVTGAMHDLGKGNFKRVLERVRVRLKLKKDPCDNYDWVLNKSKGAKWPVSFFFILGEAPHFEQSINTYRKNYAKLIKHVGDYKNVGLIFSHKALRDFNMMKKEKKRMDNIRHQETQITMHACNLVQLPGLYRNLVELEVKQDFTLYYRDTPGFRAGTCTPFLFYDLDFEIKTPLIVQPISLCSTISETENTEGVSKIFNTLQNEVKIVGGTLAVVFSNKDFADRPGNTACKQLFSQML
ncbi:MAG: hypothetical protein ACPGQR_04960, partial [Marinirhabdus sp.]